MEAVKVRNEKKLDNCKIDCFKLPISEALVTTVPAHYITSRVALKNNGLLILNTSKNIFKVNKNGIKIQKNREI